MMSIQVDSNPLMLYPPFWRHENVRYWYTGADEQQMGQVAAQLQLPPFAKIAGPVRNASGSMVYAYKIPMDNPTAWVASTMVKAPRETALSTVLDRRFDPRTVAIADTSFREAPAVQLQTLPPPAATRVATTSYAPGAIDLKLDQPAVQGQALVVSENYFPGWQATVNGTPAPTGIMNYNLIGVVLPPGATSVELRFTDAAYLKGKRLTLVALVIAAAWLVAGLALDRRGNRAPAAVPA
jgi:hypothetical protein